MHRELIKCLYEKEIAIPDEVSVVGFGDYETGELMRPPLNYSEV